MTTAESDKAFKVAEHRRERRVVNAALSNAEDLPPARLFGNPWASEKDGKRRFDPARYPAGMRK
ncbi:hypothetical protein [Devosia ginsengisoli]|nr:hypothetical protein [Devosia ginsengisoli]